MSKSRNNKNKAAATTATATPPVAATTTATPVATTPVATPAPEATAAPVANTAAPSVTGVEMTAIMSLLTNAMKPAIDNLGETIAVKLDEKLDPIKKKLDECCSTIAQHTNDINSLKKEVKTSKNLGIAGIITGSVGLAAGITGICIGVSASNKADSLIDLD